MRVKELSDKDMSVARETADTKTQSRTPHAVLKDYSMNHRVTLRWDLNDDATREQMVELRVGDNKVILDADELMKYLRWS